MKQAQRQERCLRPRYETEPRRLTQGTAGRILELLRRGAMTVDELS